MIPNSPTPDLTHVSIQIGKVDTTSAPRPLHCPRDGHPKLPEPAFPCLNVRHARHREAEVLLEMCRCSSLDWRGRRSGRGSVRVRIQEVQYILTRPVAWDRATVVRQYAVVGGAAELEQQKRRVPEWKDRHTGLADATRWLDVLNSLLQFFFHEGFWEG